MKRSWPSSNPFCPLASPCSVCTSPGHGSDAALQPAPPLGPVTTPSLFSPRAGDAPHHPHPVCKISTPGSTAEQFCGSAPPRSAMHRLPCKAPKSMGGGRGSQGAPGHPAFILQGPLPQSPYCPPLKWITMERNCCPHTPAASPVQSSPGLRLLQTHRAGLELALGTGGQLALIHSVDGAQ